MFHTGSAAFYGGVDIVEEHPATQFNLVDLPLQMPIIDIPRKPGGDSRVKGHKRIKCESSEIFTDLNILLACDKAVICI